jgi:hypothetical protein
MTHIDGATLDRDAVQAVVRTPVEILRSEPGRVRFDGVFNDLLVSASRGIPYDAQRREFIRSSAEGSWVIGIRTPRQAGLFRPQRATVTIDPGSAQHVFSLRKGQAPGGRAPTGTGIASGELIGEWTREVGLRTVSFTCNEDDFDSQGVLWLRMELKKAGGPGGLGVEPHWRINRLSVDLEGLIQP